MTAREEKVKVKVVEEFNDFEFFNNSKEWNSYYKKRIGSRKKSSPAVEWYLSWEQFEPIIMPVLQGLQSNNADQPISILVPASGDSKLSERLYSNGFKNITNVDYSEELIKVMKKKHQQKAGMQWLTKDVLAPLEEPPVLVPKSYDAILDKGCFDYLSVWANDTMQDDRKYLFPYLFKVKHLLGNNGKFIVFTRLYLESPLAVFYHRFWLGWKMIVQKIFPQKDGEKAVILVLERCPDGLVHEIGFLGQEDKKLDTGLSLEVKQQNKLIAKYRERAKSKEEFERSLRDNGPENCCEVDVGAYRIFVLTNIDKFHDAKNVDVLWVPEDYLEFHSDALTNSKHWQLELFFSTVTRSSALLFIVLSPTLQLHSQSDNLMDRVRLDLKPLLESINPNIQFGWLKMWNKEHQIQLNGIDFLPDPRRSKPPTPRRSKSSNKKMKGSQQSGTSKGKDREKLEKDDNCEEKEVDDCDTKGLNYDESIVAVGDSDKADEAVDESIVEESKENVDLIGIDSEAVSQQQEKGRMTAKETSNSIPFDFPTFYDGDAIPYYSQPFTIASWLQDHEEKEDRWLGEYGMWKDILPQVECPRLLRRESLRIMQSIIIGLLDYHERYGAHDGLHDWTNIVIAQVVFNHIGSKIVRFEAKLLPPDRLTTFDDESLIITKKRGDMHNLLQILEKVLEGGTKNSELQCLGNLLFDYPYEKQEDIWKILLLKNYPAFWDGSERAGFLVSLYFHMVSNVNSSSNLKWAIQGSEVSNQHLNSWLSLIPQNTIFEKVLYGDDLTKDQSWVKKYLEGDMKEAVRYMRVVLHQFREIGGSDLDVRYIEAALSYLFENYVLKIYSRMCSTRTFL